MYSQCTSRVHLNNLLLDVVGAFGMVGYVQQSVSSVRRMAKRMYIKRVRESEQCTYSLAVALHSLSC